MKYDFFGGWADGIRSGKNLKWKMVLTFRIIKNSLLGLYYHHKFIH